MILSIVIYSMGMSGLLDKYSQSLRADSVYVISVQSIYGFA